MKILIIQLRQLGDVLLTSTLAKAIKEHISNAQVDFLTSLNAKDIVELNPYIDNVIAIKKGLVNELSTIKTIRNKKYDYLIDVQRTATTKRISLFSKATKKIAFRKDNDNFYYNCLVEHENCDYTVDDRLLLLKPMGIKTKKGRYLPELYYGDNVKDKIDTMLKNMNITDKFFVVMPTARKAIKSWPLDYFDQLINKIYKELHYVPIIVVAPNESDTINKLNLSKQFHIVSNLNIKELAYLIKKADFFIGNDSFGGHVAVSQNTLAFIIIGFSSGWFPSNEKTIKITARLDCQPCNDWKKCPYPKINGYLKCFSVLDYATVFETISKFLKGSLNTNMR